MEDFNEININDISETPKPPSVFGMTFSKMTSDMKFMGMFYIVYGVLSSLSIVGAIIGIPLLISGLRLREASAELSSFHRTNNSNHLRRGFELQGKFFNIQKIIIIVGIVLVLLYFVAIFLFFGSLAATATDY